MIYRKGATLFNEIHGQSDMWKSVLSEFAARSEEIKGWLKAQGFGQVIFVSSGDYLNIAMSVARITNLVVGLNSVAVPASELLYGRRAPYDVRIKTLAVVMSSTDLAEEIGWGVDRLKQLDPRVQILSLEVGESILSAKANQSIVLANVKDSTKIAISSVTAMLLAGYNLVSWLSGRDVLSAELNRLPDILATHLKDWQTSAQRMVQKKPGHVVFLGSGPFLGLAKQSALTMRQMAGITCEAHTFVEYRHGYFASLTNLMSVMGLISNSFGPTEEKVIGDLAVTRVNRLAICDAANPQLGRRCDDILELKTGVNEVSRGLLLLPVIQLYCFYMAIGRGINPDNPKHLDHPKMALKEAPGTMPSAKAAQ
ncbi:hypothetical protein IJT17_02670 [bacterium]|nr:hypothetical protein [bacterium]